MIKESEIKQDQETECTGCCWLNRCSQQTSCLMCEGIFKEEQSKNKGKKCNLPETIQNFYCKHPRFMTENGLRGRFIASFGKNRIIIDHWPDKPTFCPLAEKNK